MTAFAVDVFAVGAVVASGKGAVGAFVDVVAAFAERGVVETYAADARRVAGTFAGNVGQLAGNVVETSVVPVEVEFVTSWSFERVVVVSSVASFEQIDGGALALLTGHVSGSVYAIVAGGGVAAAVGAVDVAAAADGDAVPLADFHVHRVSYLEERRRTRV